MARPLKPIDMIGYPEKFELALRYGEGPLQQNPALSDSDKLLFYAVSMQAQKGPCKEPRPSMWDVVAKAKWNAWNDLGKLSAFEAMGPDYYELVAASDTGRRPFAPGAGPCVLIESMGYHPQSDRLQFEELLVAAGEDGLLADAVLAESGKQVAELWRVREAAEVIVRAMSPFVSFDISLGIADIEPFLPRVREALAQRFGAVRTATFGHLGDNNIHIAAHVGPDTAVLETEVEAVVFGVLRDYDGAITAEHGIGRHKRVFLPAHKHAGEMEMMLRVRDALDPLRLLNRNVLF
jgi:FAD/FMN-containing dehydrogenase